MQLILWPRQLTYAYAKADPIKNRDRSGLDPCGGCNTTLQCMLSCFSSDFLPIFLAALAACILIAGWVCAALFAICFAAFFAACTTVVLCIVAFLLFLACLLPCEAFIGMCHCCNWYGCRCLLSLSKSLQ